MRGVAAGGRLGAVLLLALVATVSGCATITYEAPLIESMVAMNRAADGVGYERVGDFEIERRAVFVVAQLITVTDAELEDALRRELARTGGDAVINLRIHEEYDIIDFLVAAVAGGIVNSRAVTLRGDVVRWTEAGAAEALLERAGPCLALDLEEPDGTTRRAHACAG